MAISKEERQYIRRRTIEILQHRINPTKDGLTFREIFKQIFGEAAIARMSYDRVRDLENAVGNAISWHRDQGCEYIKQQFEVKGKNLRDKKTLEDLKENPVDIVSPLFLPYAAKMKIRGQKEVYYVYYNAVEEKTKEGLVMLFDEKINGLSYRRLLFLISRLNNSTRARRRWEAEKARLDAAIKKKEKDDSDEDDDDDYEEEEDGDDE